MSKEDDIYAAGLIDGEGTITLSRLNKSEYRAPIVSVPSTTPALVTTMKAMFGGFISKKSNKEKHTPSQAWAARYDTAITCLERVTPYLREPEKIRRARLILNEYKKLTVRNGRYTEEQRAAKLDFERRFFEVSRGRLKL
jgi:hypothetical protein